MEVLCLFFLYQLVMFRWVFCDKVSNKWQKLNTTGITFGPSLPLEGPVSPGQCLAKCSETETCVAANVHRENLQCELSEHYPLENCMAPNQRPGFTVYIRGMKQVLDAGNTMTGFKTIYPDGINPVEVLCIMDEDGSGWAVIQKRESASDFYRSWQEYRDGFGDKTNFWIGLKNIHRLTSQGNYELRIDMRRGNGERAAPKYQTFAVGSEAELFILSVDGYSHDPNLVDPGDGLTHHNRMKFTTYDNDNDLSDDINCSSDDRFKGGNWYSHCYMSNLNGVYGRTDPIGQGLIWRPWIHTTESLVYTRMMIRPT